MIKSKHHLFDNIVSPKSTNIKGKINTYLFQNITKNLKRMKDAQIHSRRPTLHDTKKQTKTL